MAFLVSLALKIQNGVCFQAFSAWVFSSLCEVFAVQWSPNSVRGVEHPCHRQAKAGHACIDVCAVQHDWFVLHGLQAASTFFVQDAYMFLFLPFSYNPGL